MKALLLAAGYGTRLKPLTDFIPKPLTLFMGRPILDIVLDQVRAAGISEVAVNTHHLALIMQEHIQKLVLPNQPIHISHELEILGTGGSINPLRPWLADDDLLIFNGDIVSTIDLSSMIRAFRASKACAAMALIPYKTGTTPVSIQGDRVVGIGAEPSGSSRRTFSGIHILSRAFVEHMPREGFFSVIDTYQRLLRQGEPILAFEHDGYWADLGIPQDYLEAHKEFWGSSDRSRLAKSLHLEENAWDYDEGQRSLFVSSPRFSGVRDSFVFGPLKATRGADLDQCIVYPGVDLADGKSRRGLIMSPMTSLSIM